jgi:hypothetical protein
MAGVWGAAPLIWREILEAQGVCDYAPCVNAATAPTLAAFCLVALLGIALMVIAARDLLRKPLFVVSAVRFLALAGTVIAVLSVTSTLIAGYDHPVEVAVPAVVLAVVVSAIGFAPRLRSSWAGAVMIVAGLLGFAATLRWGLNTNYYLAVLLWLVAAGLLVAKGSRSSGAFRKHEPGSEPNQTPPTNRAGIA